MLLIRDILKYNYEDPENQAMWKQKKRKKRKSSVA